MVMFLLMDELGNHGDTSMGNEKFCISRNLPGFLGFGISESGEDWNEPREASISEKGKGPM